ncbi:MAG: hypothetical protein AAFQ02_10040 [Bacteroidota bacterium]
MENKSLLNYFSTQVHLYLDNRLNADSEENLLKACDQDNECNKLFQQEKTFRDFVKNNVKRPCVSTDVLKHIKDKCC